MVSTIVVAWALDKALERYRFRNPKEEDTPLAMLPQHTRNVIVAEALQLQEGKRCSAHHN